jgi:hypothetical protein
MSARSQNWVSDPQQVSLLDPDQSRQCRDSKSIPGIIRVVSFLVQINDLAKALFQNIPLKGTQLQSNHVLQKELGSPYPSRTFLASPRLPSLFPSFIAVYGV